MLDKAKFIRGDDVCFCDRRQFADFEAEGWKRAGAEKKAPVRVEGILQKDEPQASDELSLEDLFDDRALPALAKDGITSIEQFIAAADEDEQGLADKIPYLTVRSIAKVRKAIEG
jgi:hypothetical protein